LLALMVCTISVSGCQYYELGEAAAVFQKVPGCY
jgi:hypothetical protein